MANTTARIKKGGKHYEVLVDLEEAIKLRKNEAGASINAAVLGDAIFHNLKSGERCSMDDLENEFGSSVFEVVAEKIIKSGEVVRTEESMNKDRDLKYKQVVDFLVRNAVSPEGRPYTPDRIMKALKEAHVNVKNKPVESQVSEILDQLGKVLAISVEKKKVKLLIPAIHSGKAYGIVKEFKVSEDWKNNGDVEVVVEVPSGLIMDFYDRINSATQGSVMSEEIKG
ncbi:ribosome assembly factor SBDS [Methanococcoides sp. SA1]|nr:ribosome assembly factor SBDS [Methanococcoides sp. SA1]